MLCRSLAVLTFLFAFVLPVGALAAPGPGDTYTASVLSANFDADIVGQAPDVTLPGAPSGDSLTLNQAAGEIVVESVVDGLTKPAHLKQANTPGGLGLFCWAVPSPGATSVAVSWRSVAQDDNPVSLVGCELRSTGGALLASVEYNSHGLLTYNAIGGAGQTLPITYTNNRSDRFTIVVDFLTGTSSLSVNGTPVAGFQSVPFPQSGSDFVQVGFEGIGVHPQSFSVDDIAAVATFRVPDYAPSVTAPATAAGTEAIALAFSVAATDPDGQAITSLTASPLPLGATFTPSSDNSSGDFAWTPGYSQAGTYNVTFTAANTLSASAATAITIANADRAPAVTAPATASGAEAVPFSIHVSASDPDGDPFVSLAASPLPLGAVFTPSSDNSSGDLAWTPDYTQAGTYTVTFTVTNALSASAATAITIANTDRAPAVTAPATASGAEAVPFSLLVSASDPDGDAIASLTATALPAGATFTPSLDNATGLLAWTPGFGQAGSYGVTFTAANVLSGAATTTITISHTDRVPVVSAPAGIAGEEGGTMAFTVSATDPDGDAISSLTADLSALPPTNDASFSVSSDQTTGSFIWHMQTGDAGSYQVTFTATNLLTSTFTTTIYVGQAGVGVAGVFRWTPQPGDEGVWYVTWSATDAGGTTTAQTEITVVGAGSAPAAAPQQAPRAPGAGVPPNMSRVPMAPQNPMKGPIISATGTSQTTTGTSLTLSSYATSSTTVLVASPVAALKAGSVRTVSTTATRAAAAISLTADLSGLPTGNDAQFVVDQEPQITAPAALTVDAGVPVYFQALVWDPNGDPIENLTANLSGLPAGNDASFSVNGAHNTGTFTWNPAVTDAGTFAVSFTASNRLVGTASTSITVRPAAAARVFLTGSQKLQLGSNRLFWCWIEPIAGAFNLTNVNPATIKMISSGTGSVSEIAAVSGKTVVIGDKDGNNIQDMSVNFSKDALRQLFDGLTGKTTVTVVIQGHLFSGAFFRGNLTMDVVPTNKTALAVSVSPNPFNPEAKLSFTLPQAGFVRVRVYDLQGRLARTLLDEQDAAAGPRTITFDGRSNSGGRLASGVYFFRIESKGGSENGRLVIVQ